MVVLALFLLFAGGYFCDALYHPPISLRNGWYPILVFSLLIQNIINIYYIYACYKSYYVAYLFVLLLYCLHWTLQLLSTSSVHYRITGLTFTMMLPSQSDKADPTTDDGTVPSRSDQAVPAANIVMPKLSCRCYIADVVVPIFPCHADPTADES